MRKNRWRQATFGVLAWLMLCGFETRSTSMLITYTDAEQYVHHVAYDLEHKTGYELDKAGSSPEPTAVLTKDGQTLYETGLDGEGKARLFQVDVKEKTRKPLTEGFVEVKQPRLDEEQGRLLMLVRLSGTSNLHLASLDVQSGAMEVWWPAEKDRSVLAFDMAKESGEVVAWTYSLKESEEKRKASQGDGLQEEAPNYHLVKLNPEDKSEQEVTTAAMFLSDLSVSPDGRHALFSARFHKSGLAHETVFHADLQNGNLRPMFADQGHYRHIVQPQLAAEGRGIYFLAERTDRPPIAERQGEPIHPRVVGYYDFKSKALSEVWFEPNVLAVGYRLLR
jgi:hypothetical protein